MDLNPLSCDGFLMNKSSSSDQFGLDPCAKLKSQKTEKKPPSEECEPNKCISPVFSNTSSTSSSLSCGMLQDICRPPKQSPKIAPNIDYELAIAKSIMQEYSTISGDNLFDHLSDIIKRVIDERPPNVIDFFEEFSRNVREQKFHLPERFPPDKIFEETRLFKAAKKQLISMNLPYTPNMSLQAMNEDDLEEERTKVEALKLELKQEPKDLFRTFYDRVQHLQFFWNQCGFSISSEDIFQLACSMNRLQTHPSIRECRFWGMINGLKASYYIVEASLTNEERESRLVQMESELKEKKFQKSMELSQNHKYGSHIGPELTPGVIGWNNYPEEDLIKMKPSVLPVPTVKMAEEFDVPVEPIGRGINRYSYFVVNSLSDEWIELPIVTPKQVITSRQIKKFFTGDLEADIISYPYFEGKEKHYLRAMIARITAGSYIAPKGYYRKMTQKERRLYEGEEPDEAEEEEEDAEEESLIGEDEEEGEKEADNDIVLLKNEKYNASTSIYTLNKADNWLHVRPNILLQGRVVWFDEEKARRERENERKRLEKLRLQEEMEEHEYEDENEEKSEGEEEGEEEEFAVNAEKGPAILTPCSEDTYSEIPITWMGRFTSKFTNENERILVMQSNVWPGAYTFVYKDICESIYLGWGHKYVARNMAWQHLPPITEEYPHLNTDFIEANDPTVEMEEAYQLSLLKQKSKLEYKSDYENEDLETTDEAENDDDDDDDDEEEEEEEE